MGVERIGDDSAEADAELLAMTVECLLKSGLKEFQVSVGQVDYFKSLLQDAGLDTEAEENLRSLISQKNYFGVEDLVRSQNIPTNLEKAFLELPHLFGSTEVLAKATQSDRQYLCDQSRRTSGKRFMRFLKSTDTKNISV